MKIILTGNRKLTNQQVVVTTKSFDSMKDSIASIVKANIDDVENEDYVLLESLKISVGL